ncbi:MAG: hypothetical protein WDW36_004465 [Sanguina aurantia]
MYKPTVNQCGHAMCFWCNHRSMNPYSPSACPLCRAPYTQFPKVCVPLHSFLVWAFPKQHALRDAENKASEAEQKVDSQRVPEHASCSSRASPSVSNFLCDNPGCRRLLYQPCVLGCGHIVCHATCTPEALALPSAHPSSPDQPQLHPSSQPAHHPAGLSKPALRSSRAATASGSSHTETCPPDSESSSHPPPSAALARHTSAERSSQHGDAQAHTGPAAGTAQPAAAAASASAAAAAAAAAAETAGLSPVEDAAHPPSAASAVAALPMTHPDESPPAPSLGCPACSCRVAGGGGACHKLHSALEALFPEQVKLRAVQVQLEVEAAGRRPAPHSCGGSAVGADPAGPSAQSRRRPRSKIPEIDTLAAAGVDRGTLWRRTRELLSSQADSVYTWYQVGCDVCGAYPIKGRRYRCTECPESIGYDLCGCCRDACPDGRGRFNQNHRASHAMVKMEPVLGLGATPEQAPSNISAVGFMNMLEVLHPELSVQEAMTLMTLQVSIDDEDEAMLLEDAGDLVTRESSSEELAGPETNPHDVRADTESESSADETDAAHQPVAAHTHLSTSIITSRPTTQGAAFGPRHPAAASARGMGGSDGGGVQSREVHASTSLGLRPVAAATGVNGSGGEGGPRAAAVVVGGQAGAEGGSSGRRGCVVM